MVKKFMGQSLLLWKAAVLFVPAMLLYEKWGH
jgi:hypothetical protein